jgi:response regulator RpfG family c-di-GMP phosphodiesterase
MSTAPVPAATPHRILIVDDEEIVRVALRETLTRNGYQVVVAPNPLPALQALKEETFAVVVSDQQMPMMNGLEFLARVKQIQPDATRILITAVLSLDTVIEAINKGEIYRFIVKPWLREELLATIKNAVQRHELICKNAVLQVATMAMNEQLKELNQALANNLQCSAEISLRILQAFYPGLGDRARRVVQVCARLAGNLNLPPVERQALELAAWLHDVGLAGLPPALVERWQQGAALADAERALIEQHPVLGETWARFSDPLGAVGAAIRSHHERFDGTGYPDRLAGEGIPRLGRLLAVAVFAAGCRADEVGARLQQGSGTAFDPAVVAAFVNGSSPAPAGASVK